MKRTKNVLNNLRSIQNKVSNKVRQDVQQAVGDELLERSQREVPFDTGELSRSGFSVQQGKGVVVGYDKPYASKLHYHPEYNYQNGRKGYYLTDPALTLNVDNIAKDQAKKSLRR